MSQINDTIPKNRDIFSEDSSNLFKVVFDRIQAEIIIIDPKTHSIVDANPIAEQILGSSKNELINRKCHEYICPAKEGACLVTDQNSAITNEERVFSVKRVSRLLF
jgi:PAS domain S-box-containing protein